jgi:hypothetical protein
LFKIFQSAWESKQNLNFNFCASCDHIHPMPNSKQQPEQENIAYALPILQTKPKPSVLLRAPPAFYPIAIIAELTLLAITTWSLMLLAYNVPVSFNATLQAPSESQISLWSCLLFAIFVGNIFVILSFGRKDWNSYLFSISSFFYLLGGVSIGCFVALVQLGAQIKVLQNQSASAVAQAQQAYTNAAQTCAQVVSTNRAAFTQQPCFACDFSPITSHDIGLTTSLDTEYWDAEPIYWTQSVQIDQIVCESEITSIGVEIWPWFVNNSIHLNESMSPGAWPCDPVKPVTRPDDLLVPGHFTSWLDHGGMQLFLLGVYELAFHLYAPMTINVSRLPTTDCVWLHGVASERFALTTICGKGNAPNPAQRSGVPSNFASCTLPQLLSWQAAYTSELAALNQSIYSVPKVSTKLANFENGYGDSEVIAMFGIIVGLVVGTGAAITGIVRLQSKKRQENEALLGNINN